MTRRGRRVGLSTIALLCAALVAPTGLFAAAATAPGNDDLENAQEIGALPATVAVASQNTTMQPGEPACPGMRRTVWYKFIAEEDALLAASFTSYAVALGLYTGGPTVSQLTRLQCFDLYELDPDGLLPFQARAGATYYLQVARYVDVGPTTFDLTLEEVAPPANDDASNAIPVRALPFLHDLRTILGATLEPGEPQPPALATPHLPATTAASVCAPIDSTVWYEMRLDALADVRVSLPSGWYWWDAALAVYDRTAGMTLVGCNDDFPAAWIPCGILCSGGGDPYEPGSRVDFVALPGHAYLVQVGASRADGASGEVGPLRLSVETLAGPS